MALDLPTFKDLFRVARDEVLARSTRLTRQVVDREGTDANAFIAADAAVGDELVGALTRVAASLFLDSASGQALDRWVFDRYQLTRKPASAALGTVEFTTVAPAAGAFAIPVNTKLSTADGKTFLTAVGAVFPAFSTGPIAVAVRSSAAGLNQQAQVNTINNILSQIPGAPSDLAVTNSLATAGADDEESDDALRDRARRFFSTVEKATLRAIEEAALAVPGVRKAVAFEYLDQFGRPAKVGQLIISDPFTEALISTVPTPPAYQAQSQVLADTVFQALSNTRALGIYVKVFVASVVLQGVTLGLTFQAGVDVDLTAFRARAAIVSLINELEPGQALTIDNMINRLRAVPGLIVTGGEILSPPGTVVPQQLQVLRSTMGLVVASTVQPDRALQGSTNSDT